MKRGSHVQVGVVCGSKSDLPILERAVVQLTALGIVSELHVLSAHRTPEQTMQYAKGAEGRGLEVIIAAAGGAAHLPGVIAALTTLPVIGLPIPAEPLRGIDALLSIVQMPRGVPVAAVAIGNAENAALLAASILSLKYPEIKKRLLAFREEQTRVGIAGSSPQIGQ